jgi:hypothetical protein
MTAWRTKFRLALTLRASAVLLISVTPRCAPVTASGAAAPPGRSSRSDPCEVRLRDWESALAAHLNCEKDSECAPTELVDTYYECTAVNAGWWATARGHLAPLVYGCPFMHRTRPDCCVVSCKKGRCQTHEEPENGTFCVPDSRALPCPSSAHCETSSERLWCVGKTIPGVGYCVKDD